MGATDTGRTSLGANASIKSNMMIATLVLAMALATVQADWYSGDFTFECPSGESISAASSDPKWPNEDRKWFFRCQGGGLVKEDCDAAATSGLSAWVDGADATGTVACPEGNVATGFKHTGGLYSLKCTKANAATGVATANPVMSATDAEGYMEYSIEMDQLTANQAIASISFADSQSGDNFQFDVMEFNKCSLTSVSVTQLLATTTTRERMIGLATGQTCESGVDFEVCHPQSTIKVHNTVQLSGGDAMPSSSDFEFPSNLTVTGLADQELAMDLQLDGNGNNLYRAIHCVETFDHTEGSLDCASFKGPGGAYVTAKVIEHNYNGLVDTQVTLTCEDGTTDVQAKQLNAEFSIYDDMHFKIQEVVVEPEVCGAESQTCLDTELTSTFTADQSNNFNILSNKFETCFVPDPFTGGIPFPF